MISLSHLRSSLIHHPIIRGIPALCDSLTALAIISKSGQPSPAAPQEVRRSLASGRGEDALLVAADLYDPRHGGEVGEVLHLLAHDRLDPVEDAVGYREHLDLVALGPGVGEDVVQAGEGVSAIASSPLGS